MSGGSHGAMDSVPFQGLSTAPTKAAAPANGVVRIQLFTTNNNASDSAQRAHFAAALISLHPPWTRGMSEISEEYVDASMSRV